MVNCPYCDWEKQERHQRCHTDKDKYICNVCAELLKNHIQSEHPDKINTNTNSHQLMSKENEERADASVSLQQQSNLVSTQKRSSSFFSKLTNIAISIANYFDARRDRIETEIRVELTKQVSSELEIIVTDIELKIGELHQNVDNLDIAQINNNIISALQEQIKSQQLYINKLQERTLQESQRNRVLYNKNMLLHRNAGTIPKEKAEKLYKPLYITVEGQKLASTFLYSDRQKRMITILVGTRPMSIVDIAFQAQVPDGDVKSFFKTIVSNDYKVVNSEGNKWMLVWYLEGGDKSGIKYMLLPEGEVVNAHATKIPVEELM